MAKDVIVVVQRDTLPSEKESLDILLVSTKGEYPVGTYRDIGSVKAVYGPDGPSPNEKIVRKAATLLNQGHTSLAESLITKFKIVGFAPPNASVATNAKYAVTFKNGNLEAAIEANTKMYVRIGGDAVVEITASSEVSTGADLAALFSGASFTIEGNVYTADVASNVVTFTAKAAGEKDTIPAIVEIFADEQLSQDASVEIPTAKFTNGEDDKTAADNLITAIKKFQSEIDNDWYYLLVDREDDEYVKALAAFAEASEPSEAELGAGVEDHRKFYMGQTSNKNFANENARAAVIYTDKEYLNEEPDASYTGNVGPFYPTSVTWKFKRPQNGNSNDASVISLPKLTEGERNQLLENHVNFLTEEYKRQYVKEGTCLDGEFIDVVLGGDWIAKRMRDLLYDIMLKNANIDYDDSGFGLVATAVMQTLSEAVDYNIIAKDAESKAGIFNVTIPKFAETTEEQRANRIMPPIRWEAQLAGAVHQVKTKGVLRVSL